MTDPEDEPFEWGSANAAGPRLLHRVEVVGGALCGVLGVLVGAGAVLSLDLRGPALIFIALLVGAACAVLAASKLVPLVQRALVRVGLARLSGVPLWHDWIVRAEDEHGRSVGGWLSAATYRDALPKYSPMRIWSEARQQWREQLPKRASRVAVYKVAVSEPWNRPALYPRRTPPPGTLVGWIDEHGQHERREVASGRRKRKARPGRSAPTGSGGP
jgi:hypothetical protein